MSDRVGTHREITILDAMADPQLLARFFTDHASWKAWRTFLAVLFGHRLAREQRELFCQCTGRQAPQPSGYREAWLVVGRRGGKSFALATIAVFLSCFRSWRKYLGPGERATVMVIAADRKQARVILRYVRGIITSVPMLSRLIENETRESIALNNHVTIEVHTASYRTTRGYSICACLCDEIAFWSSEDASEPDREIINAIRPAMATIPGAMLLCASSPYARKGALWDAHRKHFAKNGDPILIWQAPTRVMNATVPQSIVDAAMEDDPASAAAEWLAQFRSDVESFIARESVEACVSVGVRERAPVGGTRYSAFVDPSGGSADSMTLAIAHREKDVAVLDAVREVKPPFSPEAVVSEFAATLKGYRVSRVQGDRFGGEWPREVFRKLGIEYEPSAKAKSDIYRDMLPAVNSRRVDLLDHPKLVAQLCGLERRTARGGRDSIDHVPGGHDDIANAVAGAINIAAEPFDDLSWVCGVGAEADAAWQRFRLQQRLFGRHLF
jgi:hypothetical protein